MGKYIGSPWGFVRGKMGDYVGGVWKGVVWVRVRILPTQRGTVDLYRDLKDGIIPPERFSFSQMNIRRAITQVLGYIGRRNISAWIYPIWEALVTKRGWTMTGINAFVKRNAALLLTTMDRTAELILDSADPDYNEPDLSKMLVSDGDLEGPAALLTAAYDATTGDLEITWDPTVYTNGHDTDKAYVMVAKKPLLESVGRDGTWYPSLFMYGPYVAEPMAVLRESGTITYTLPADLDYEDLTAFLFFRDTEDIIGFSPSLGLQATEAAP